MVANSDVSSFTRMIWRVRASLLCSATPEMARSTWVAVATLRSPSSPTRSGRSSASKESSDSILRSLMECPSRHSIHRNFERSAGDPSYRFTMRSNGRIVGSSTLRHRASRLDALPTTGEGSDQPMVVIEPQ